MLRRSSKCRKILFVFQVLIAVFVFLLCLCFSNNATSQFTNITQLNYNISSDFSPYKIDEFELLLERINGKLISFCSEQNDTVIKEESVTPILTNEWYFENYETITKGTGFTEENINSGDKVAVISDKLALKMFFSTDAVGKIITLNSENYKICGIYSESNFLINEISGDGKQRVYIPYTSFNEYGECEIDTISYNHKAISAPLMEQMNLQQYHFTDFAEKTKVIKNIEHIVWLVVFAMSAVIILKIWYKLCRKFIFEIRDNLKENYFITSLKTISIKYILLVLIAIGIPMLLLTVFWVSDFSIYMVSKYIPCDNIFDVSYYLQTIIENENLQNSLTLTGNTYLLKLYSNTFTVLIWLTIIFVIWLFFIIVKIISLYKHTQQS